MFVTLLNFLGLNFLGLNFLGLNFLFWNGIMKKHPQSINYRTATGFTLIEVMVVVAILSILAAIIVPKIMGRPEQARIVKVKQDILATQSALDLYKLDNGVYPSTDQGLQALVTKPSVEPLPRNWKTEGYLQELPVDPWSQPYQYMNDNEKIRIFSYGPKGKDGNSEIGNWNMNEATESKS
jgi:general secretion pathway protein G